ncbi:MAG: AAA family ATPase [Candidatus Rokubacteria bacterium]|nr:AAA family ATPase [Candidatus Rokubacteria bacterium]
MFRFNEALNCIIGPNYAGKSAVFDFIRFALAQEDSVPEDSRRNLLTRLLGILGSEGCVELYLLQRGRCYVIRRVFNPRTVGSGLGVRVEGCYDRPAVYQFDPEQGQLIPVEEFAFPIEVYEQGRIHRLRDDVGRQLEMLDEFANVAGLKVERAKLLAQLSESAERLAPLYDEREELKSAVANLPQLKAELTEKEQYLPGEEEKKWGAAAAFVGDLENIVGELVAAAGGIPDLQKQELSHRRSELERLFGQKIPALDAGSVIHSELLAAWQEAVRSAVAEIVRAGAEIVSAVSKLDGKAREFRDRWKQEQGAHERTTSERLAKAGVESPKEIIRRVEMLRREIHSMETKKRPRLAEVDEQIDREEVLRQNLLDRLETLDRDLAERRQQKAQELTDSLEGQIKVSVDPAADRMEYRKVLDELCNQITTREHKIQGREGQLDRIINSISPIRLARALADRGVVRRDDGSTTALQELCGITQNTQNVLARIADSVRLLNRLQTIVVPDVPRIVVRRRGESAYADLRTGLSPGEQSAAVLTLALQTRTMPLLLDQPEDELGYSYVVHLIVPKILRAKFTRQLLVVTHNANIPVLGDGDYVTKMENRPRDGGGRECVVAEAGCFESHRVTAALLELEGGVQAFKFRQHRYSLPR